jgi:hypothetical protein
VNHHDDKLTKQLPLPTSTQQQQYQSEHAAARCTITTVYIRRLSLEDYEIAIKSQIPDPIVEKPTSVVFIDVQVRYGTVD